jgi:hypothetical protein
VPNQNEKKEVVELEQLNAELTQSWKRCRKLLFDPRAWLAENSNVPTRLDDESQE